MSYRASQIYILVITSRNRCQILAISFHLFWQYFSRIFALSLIVEYLPYNCQAQKSRITNMKARKALMGKKKDQVRERKMEVKQ